mgnify:CR=1 FL=1
MTRPVTDDLRAVGERLGDRPGAEIGVRGDDAIADAGSGPPVVHVLRAATPCGQQLVEPRHQVVAVDHGEGRRELLRPAGGCDPAAQAGTLTPPAFADDADAARDDVRQHRLEHAHEVVGVAQLGFRSRWRSRITIVISARKSSVT